jgi:hypothetical protein
MDGKLPEIFWYVFWIFFVLGCFGAAWVAGRNIHARRMKALDILRMYAEKGAEPPPAMMDRLAEQAYETPKPGAPAADPRGALIQGFIGFTFMACILFAAKLWLQDARAPNWSIYAAQAGEAFFGFGAFGLIVAAIVTRGQK